ncbi:zinc finger protein 143-like [Watersipora subatra]|uniref:zinc finger protein 143-like n=1 Tax=Watersipora subatra TaxID=2589382 RepID=UPI00355C99AE
MMMETTDQNMHQDTSEHMGPLLMHDPDDEDENRSLASSGHNLLSDVHLPTDSTFITSDVDKGGLEHISPSMSLEKEVHPDLKPEERESEMLPDDGTQLKFADGQPVTLEDGSTAYVLSRYKEGTQPIIFEDGTTMYISHDPPATAFHSPIDASALHILNELGEPEDKRMPSTVIDHSSEQKLFKCENEGCRKVYTTIHHLQYHKRSHLERKPFVCGYTGCDKTFSTSYGLKSHIRVHTGEKPYKCPHVNANCTKAFKTSGDLQKHIRTHTGEKPFRCPFQDCDRSFTTTNIRKVHIRTHTGEKPYSCDECGKRFASATNHRNHMRIHTGEKPYACSHEGCSKRFTEYSSLYKHQVVHSADKPYMCNRCRKLYRQASTLAMHKRTAHGETEVSMAEADMISSQLLALEQGKEGVLSAEVVGMVAPQNKQFSGSRVMVPTQQLLSSPNRKADDQQLHFTHISPENVVIVTDSSCYKVMPNQASTSSDMGGQILYASPLADQARTLDGRNLTSSNSPEMLVSQNIGLTTPDLAPP